ncbi:MAG TPA: outer membrane beta-barrel protein [Gemmatimonadaceae bacterium]
MKTNSRIIAFAVALVSAASTLSAQSFSFGLRGSGSVPTGAFSDQGLSAGSNADIEGAKNGFGYGLDVGLALKMFGIYAGFDRIKFDCETTTCRSDGKYTLSGVTAGVKLAPGSTTSMLRPFVKAGLTFNKLKGGYGGQSSNVLTTDTAPGYEVGVGADVTLLGLLSFSPQARYVGQNLKAKVPGVAVTGTTTGQAVNYFTVDLGLSVHTPFTR